MFNNREYKFDSSVFLLYNEIGVVYRNLCVTLQSGYCFHWLHVKTDYRVSYEVIKMAKPNVLFIFSDQQHKYALGKTDPVYRTPSLDHLCEDGVCFSHAYSSNPVCGPYRGCLMTGLMTCRNGVDHNNDPLPEGNPLLAEEYNAAGYETGFVGKWHLGGKGAGPIPENLRGGFTHFIGYQCYNGFDPAPPYNNDVTFYDESDRPWHIPIHRTQATTEFGIQMLNRFSESGKPFFLMVGYQAPHYPEQPLKEFELLYKESDFDSPEPQPEPYTPTFNPRSPSNREECPDYRRYGGRMAKYKQLYAAMVSQIDAGVGRLIETLKRLNLYDNTVIIYTSDHGDMQGSRGLTNKCLPYEKSAGVPLIVHMPGGISGRTLSVPVDTTDLFATLSNIIGNQYCGDGQSLLSLLKGDTGSFDGKNAVSMYTIGQSPWAMLVQNGYKLIVSYPSLKSVELYDVSADPEERCNLVDDKNEQARISQMLDTITERIIK
jgi:arylsulfatase A-like enzyme